MPIHEALVSRVQVVSYCFIQLPTMSDPSDSGSTSESTQNIMKNIMSSFSQLAPSRSSSYSTEKILLKIQNAGNYNSVSSSPSDVSLSDGDPYLRNPVKQPQHYHLLMKEQKENDTPSDDDEYQPPILGLGRELENPSEADLGGGDGPLSKWSMGLWPIKPINHKPKRSF